MQQYAELSDISKAEQLHHASLLKRLEAERRARRIVVPTDENEVRSMLRKLGHPIRLFGESAADVRERLRELLARVEIQGEERALVALLLSADKEINISEKKDQDHDDVYTHASADLIEWRKRRATRSFDFASKRLATQRERRDDVVASARHEELTLSQHKTAKRLALTLSQFADPRPLSRVRCLQRKNDAPLIASVAWSGNLKLWRADDELNKPSFQVKCSDHRVTGLDFCSNISDVMLCIGLADGTAQVWRGNETNLQIGITLKGHAQRLGHVSFLDTSSIVTAGFDHTWRLWDIATGQELQLQDGHSAQVYTLAPHPDGSLLASCDFAGIVHIWDLRAGAKIHSFSGHSGKILSSQFNPDGYRLATGSDDHTVRIWDLRRRCADYTLPAHSSLISDLRFLNEEILGTCAFDGTLSLWNCRDFKPLRTVAAHDGKTMSIDFFSSSSSSFSVVSAGFDRTLKLWTSSSTSKSI